MGFVTWYYHSIVVDDWRCAQQQTNSLLLAGADAKAAAKIENQRYQEMLKSRALMRRRARISK
jgi:hypothetical protein